MSIAGFAESGVPGVYHFDLSHTSGRLEDGWDRNFGRGAGHSATYST